LIHVMATSFPLSCEQPLPDRLVELLKLEVGWLDGEGDAYDPALLAWLAGGWKKHAEGIIPTPYTYPAVDGGIRMEWSLADAELAVDIHISKQLADVWKVDLISGEMAVESQFSLTTDDGWLRFVDCLRDAAQ
jgi:hypothetical protein